MRAAAGDGLIPSGNLDVRCPMLLGALCDAGMLLARADDPAAALPEVAAAADHLLDALVQPTVRTTTG